MDKEYHKAHYHLRKKNGKATRCEFKETCSGKSTTFDWALKKGYRYSDDVKDYIQLCRSCHAKYDEIGKGKTLSKEHKEILRLKQLGVKPPNKGNDSRVNKVCKNCGCDYRAYKDKNKNYCSMECRNKDMIGKPSRNPKGRGGKDDA